MYPNTKNERFKEYMQFDLNDKFDGLNLNEKIVSIDCEMVMTVKGKELARVTVLDFDYNVILDELVKPEFEVIDYLT